MASGSNEDLDGYVTAVDYPSRLIPQLTPGWVAAVAAWHGLRPPDTRGSLRMLDIGCGTGIALAMAAACHPSGAFHGIDGMASHVGAGRTFAAGLDNLTLTHATFDQALPDARPDCDIVTCHGVLTWAGPRAREDAMALAAARLAPGGLLVVSYNAFPGAARQLAFQHLVRHFTADAAAPPAPAYHAAFERIRGLAGAGFDAVPPGVVDHLADLAREAPDAYFVHEYMHDGWAPLWPAEVKARFAGAGLDHVGQADFLRLRPEFCLTARQRAEIDRADPADRDMLTDMALDTPFRIDLYVRGPARRQRDARAGIWLGAEAEPGGALDIVFPAGAVPFDEDLARAVLEALAEGPLPVEALRARVPGDPDAVAQAIDGLLIGDHLVPLSPPLDRLPDAAATLNRNMADRAVTQDDLPIAARAGRAGPVVGRPVELAALAMTADRMLERAAGDPAFRKRFLYPGLDPDDAGQRRRVAAGLAQLRARFRRLAAD